jgi:hypothetical protein
MFDNHKRFPVQQPQFTTVAVFFMPLCYRQGAVAAAFDGDNLLRFHCICSSPQRSTPASFLK